MKVYEIIIQYILLSWNYITEQIVPGLSTSFGYRY